MHKSRKEDQYSEDAAFVLKGYFNLWIHYFV